MASVSFAYILSYKYGGFSQNVFYGMAGHRSVFSVTLTIGTTLSFASY